jgi:ABC-type enterochelin transport system permease subunit
MPVNIPMKPLVKNSTVGFNIFTMLCTILVLLCNHWVMEGISLKERPVLYILAVIGMGVVLSPITKVFFKLLCPNHFKNIQKVSEMEDPKENNSK